MSRLIHLNGAPAVGKTTLAYRYAADHPGVLVCDIDALRAMVGGWQDDFFEAGSLIRTAALAMITAYLRTGHDVVLPQLVGNPEELARFRGAAADAGAPYVGLMVTAPPGEVVTRFHERRHRLLDDEWTQTVASVVDDLGGDGALTRTCHDLGLLADQEGLVVVDSGDVDQTYAALLEVLEVLEARTAATG